MTHIPLHRYSPHKRRHQEQGVALVMVLWLIVLLTVIAASFSTHSRVETSMAGNLIERQKAKLMVETGLNRALLELMVVNNELRWKTDGQVYELQDEQGNLRIAIRNTAGLLDLNKADRLYLSRLFTLLSDDPDAREGLADSLEDWRDNDDLRRLRGAEDSDYASAGYAYGTPDRDLESVDELGYVMGFDRQAVDKLRPYVTVYSDSNSVDFGSAPEALVALLQGDTALDGDVANAFGQVESDLVDINDINGQDEDGSAPGRRYRISIEAITAAGARSAIDVDIEMSNQPGAPYRILAWHDAF
jgi:general secretion pathway protein K